MPKLSEAPANKPIYYYFPQSFFSVWAIMRAGDISARNILTPILFILCILFFRFVSGLIHAAEMSAEIPVAIPAAGDNTKRLRFTAAAIGILFTLLYLLADYSALTDGLSSRLFQLVILTACAIGFFFLFYSALLLLLFYSSRYLFKEEYTPLRFLPGACFLFCLLCWLPYFLYEYPGIMSPDSINQFEQVVGLVPYSNHHPWAHTMVIGLFYGIGRIFTDDITTAVSFFTLFQMCFMAGAAAWLTATLQKLRVKNIICIIIIAFYALVPYNAVFAVTIWKDVLFSGSVLLFTASLLRILFVFSASNRRDKAMTLIIYAASGIMMCLFRSNGWYAFLFSFPFLLYTFRHSFRLMLPLHIGILAAAVIVKGPVMTAYNVSQPDFVESVCIPLQQVARVICEDKELTDAEWESVHKVIDTTYIKDLYAPGFADNIKELVRAGNPEYLTEHKGEFLSLWFSLGVRYPGTYLQAHIDQTIGYWYPDVEYTVADIDGVIPNETGVAARPLIGGPLVVKTKEILLKLGNMLPLYGLLFSMGAMFWALICCVGIATVKKQYNRYILFLPGFAVILTLFIATPVSSEFRYAYSLVYTLPLYLCIPFLRFGAGSSCETGG